MSGEAGTTRDVVREAIYLNGLLFRISDTAGIRRTENSIEAEGIDRSFGEVRSANLVLWLFDGLEESGLCHVEQLQTRYQDLSSYIASGAQLVAIWNKSDQVGAPNLAWKEFFQAKGIPVCSISARTGERFSDLIEMITGIYAQKVDTQVDFLISRTRHFEVLGRALDAVGAAVYKVERGELFPDLLSSDLRDALSSLGEITGEFNTDDLLNHIFAEFCIGK